MTAEPGLVVVDKPGGMTSHDVVSRVRRLAETRKVGHSGTLDPMATGVLVLAVNRATRLLGHLILTDKRYDATIRLGATTTTDDAEGEIVESRPTADVTAEAVRSALAAFVGETDQVPSSVSAIKVDGKRAYARVRDGEQVDLPVRRVTVHSLEVTGLDLPEVRISVHCSSGTYIRAIARDLGTALGVGGPLTALRRSASRSPRSPRPRAQRSRPASSTGSRRPTSASGAPSTSRSRRRRRCSHPTASSWRSTSLATVAPARSPSSSDRLGGPGG